MVDDVFNLEDILPEGYRAVGMAAAIQAIDPDGEMTLITFRSESVPQWTAVGMLTSALDDFRYGVPMCVGDDFDEED